MTSFTPYDPLDPRYTQTRTGDTPYAAPWGGQTAPSPKPKKRRGKARAAGLIAGCAAVALVAGVGGGYLGSRIPAESGSSSSNGGSTVLYQSVSNKTGTGELSVADVAAKAADSVVEITTGEEAPADCAGLAKLFAGTSFEEDGVEFTAAVDDNTVTYTSTTRTAVSGYAESISLYKDADCFEDMGLSGAVVSVSVGKADTTKAENLIAAIEDLRDHNDDWYFILTDVTDPVCVTALCKWAESTEPTEAALGAGVEDHRKFYFGQTNDKEYVNEYGRSVVTYADNLAEWADAAWVGSVGPFWPESVTWKWKVPDGVSVADLRDSERDLLEENRVNFMTAEYKHEYMKNGICGDGNFIDNVLCADYITHQILENLYEIFISNKKIAYTDDGFALVAAGVFAALNRAVELHIIATDPEDDTGVYTVVIPKRADATDEQARNRQMPDIKWSAQLEGAVHSVKVNGTLRVTLNG